MSAAAAATSLVNTAKDAYAPRYVQHQPAPQRVLPTLAECAAVRRHWAYAAALSARHVVARRSTNSSTALLVTGKYGEIIQSHFYNKDHQNVIYRSSRCHGG